jgi:hypothetical protein
LIADNAEAISNGFRKVFDLEVRVNCWAHVSRLINDKLEPVTKEYQKALRKDIYKMQVIFQFELIAPAVRLFESKWKKVKRADVRLFMSYMKKWLEEIGWIEGS